MIVANITNEFEETKNKINAIIIDITIWMNVKKLKPNEDKTECMLLGSVNALKNYENFQGISTGSLDIEITLVVKRYGCTY